MLAEDVLARVDVPAFDRSNLDGFAVSAADSYGAGEERPAKVKLLRETIATGAAAARQIAAGEAMGIATGGILPRGADAVVAQIVRPCERFESCWRRRTCAAIWRDSGYVRPKPETHLQKARTGNCASRPAAISYFANQPRIRSFSCS